MNLTLTPRKTSCRDPDEMPLLREEQSSHSLELGKTQTAPVTRVPTDDMKEPESSTRKKKNNLYMRQDKFSLTEKLIQRERVYVTEYAQA